MAEFSDIRRRHIWLMKTTAKTLTHIVQRLSRAEVTEFRDGEEGWTVLEILGHLRDFDGFFRYRAQMMLQQNNPQLPAYDHEALVREGKYNELELKDLLAEFLASRAETVEFFKTLSPEDWERAGFHPERGRFTMTDAVIQVGMHDNEHIEQITRILTQAENEDAWLAQNTLQVS